MEFLTIPQYSKKFNLPQNAVREMIKSTPPKLDFTMVGTRTYIKVNGTTTQEKYLQEELEVMKNLIIKVADHIGVKNLENLLNENTYGGE